MRLGGIGQRIATADPDVQPPVDDPAEHVAGAGEQLVSGGRVIAAMMRHSSHWVTNVKRGGKPVAAVADTMMRDLAVAAAGVVGTNFAGVDMVCDQDGRLSVLEINSMPAWSGLQKTTSVDIAATFAGDLVASLPMRVQRNA